MANSRHLWPRNIAKRCKMASFIQKQLEPLILFKRMVQFIAVLFFALILFVLYLILTPQGNQTALMFISEHTPYQVGCDEFSGNLLQHIEFKNIYVKGPQFEFRAHYLHLGWHLSHLLKEHSLEYLTAKNLQVSLHTPQDTTVSTAPSFETVQATVYDTVPFPFQIDNIHLENTQITWNDHPHHLDEFIIKNASTNLAKIEAIHYQGQWGKLHASLQKAITIHWDLHLNHHPLLGPNIQDIKTQGTVLLPTRKLDSVDNQIQMQLQTKHFQYKQHRVQNLSLQLKGSLTAHQAKIRANYNQQPLVLDFSGKLLRKHWEGKIQQFNLKHPLLQKIGPLKSELVIDWQHKEIITTAKVLLKQGQAITVDAKIHKKKPYAVGGNLHTVIQDVKVLQPATELPHLQGKLQIDAALSGTLFKPKFTFDLALKEGKIRSVLYNTQATIQQLHLTLSPDNQVRLQGKGKWGKGNFTLDGGGTFHPTQSNLAFHLKGNNLLVSNTPDYYILADPNLTLAFNKNVPTLTGQIVIPEAKIQSLRNPAKISASEDVVIISDKKAKATQPNITLGKLTTRIDIILGKDIIYKGYDFSTKLGGKLTVSEGADTVTAAKGAIILKEGKYEAYGKTFNIVYGQLLYSGGPIDDPVLDVKAERKIKVERSHQVDNSTIFNPAMMDQPIIAGIKFTGHVKAPKIEFYSTPSMPDADIISYLVVNRPQHQVNEAQAEILYQAVSQLADVMKSRSDVKLDLAEKLKLDQLGFSKKQNNLSKPGQNPLEDTVFVLGKQLSDRLYLSYSIGVMDSASTFGLKYLLNKHVTVEAATGSEGPSADVVLSFESG